MAAINGSNADHVPVAIIGAGMAGLLLCQALKKKGVPAKVFERASSKNARFEGYRLGLSELAQDALHKSLPDEHWNAFNKLTEQRDGVGGLAIVDEKCEEVWDWTRFSSEPKPRIVPRSDLRDLLISDLDISYSKTFHSFKTEILNGRTLVKVRFEDGSSVSCDLLVGADGSNSRVKTSLGLEQKLDTGVRSIFLHAKATEELVSCMPDNFVTRYWVVVMKDFGIFISTWLPEREEATQDASGAADMKGHINLETVDWKRSNIAMGTLGPLQKYDARLYGRALDSLSGAELQQCFLQILEDNNADQRLCALIKSAITPSAQLVRFTSCIRPPKEWFQQNKDVPAVVIGDALHSMPPTRGMGGNLALADAADLAERIATSLSAESTSGIIPALAGFQEEISDRGFEMVGSSVFWARQYMHGGRIFRDYNVEDVLTRAELEADRKYGFADNAGIEAVRALLVPPHA